MASLLENKAHSLSHTDTPTNIIFVIINSQCFFIINEPLWLPNLKVLFAINVLPKIISSLTPVI